MRLLFIGNRAGRTGTTLSTRKSSSIGWIRFRRAPALVYALAYIAAHDATVACWDAKYTYWAIRPFMLGITPLFPTPNHPSYPAAHGCYSGSISAVLYLFPHDAIALNALGNEAGESRLWAGIHFRSDIDTGLALGRAVANLVIDRAKKDGLQ
jgi:hypothetical protein